MINKSLSNEDGDFTTTEYKELLLNTLYWITENVAIKQEIVGQDPYEKGLRKVLNLGHTVGHAIESFSLTTDTPLLHGESVALGLIVELYLSHKKLGLKEKFYLDWTSIIRNNFPELPILFRESDYETLWEFMLNDKKNNKL